jgi:NAD-dependent dihydropyrimidine dehydrogenase PreA subunit
MGRCILGNGEISAAKGLYTYLETRFAGYIPATKHGSAACGKICLAKAIRL